MKPTEDKKMDSKEAIEWIEDLREDYSEVEGNIEIVCDFNKVISLLQQGEKYKQTCYGVKELIKELEKEMVNSREEDQFGYAKQRAYDIYKSVILKLKALVEHGEKDETELETVKEELKKVWQMWDEFFDTIHPEQMKDITSIKSKFFPGDLNHYSLTTLRQLKKEIEQKYFKKGVKK